MKSQQQQQQQKDSNKSYGILNKTNLKPKSKSILFLLRLPATRIQETIIIFWLTIKIKFESNNFDYNFKSQIHLKLIYNLNICIVIFLGFQG